MDVLHVHSFLIKLGHVFFSDSYPKEMKFSGLYKCHLQICKDGGRS